MRKFGALRVEGTIFYSVVSDVIVSVRPAGFPTNSTQRQNLGIADYYGAELALSAQLSPTLELGSNYTYICRDFTIGTMSPRTV